MGKMGKSKRFLAQHRTNPMGVEAGFKSVTDNNDDNGVTTAMDVTMMEEGDNDGYINEVAEGSHVDGSRPVIEMLSSIEPEERAYACSSIVSIASDRTDNARRLLRLNVAHLLSNIVKYDSDRTVVMEAMCALRSVIIAGDDAAICRDMMEKGVLAIVCEMLALECNKISAAETISEGDVDARDARKLTHSLLEHGVTFVWVMIENSDRALEAIQSSGCLSMLFQLVDISSLPIAVVLAVIQCLHTASEENSHFWLAFNADPSRYSAAFQACLSCQDIKHPDSALLLRISTAGIVSNLLPFMATVDSDTESNALTAVLKCAHDVLSIDNSANLVEITEMLPIIAQAVMKQANGALGLEPKLQTAMNKLKLLHAQLNGAMLVLEVLANTLTLVDFDSDTAGGVDMVNGNGSDDDWEDMNGGHTSASSGEKANVLSNSACALARSSVTTLGLSMLVMRHCQPTDAVLRQLLSGCTATMVTVDMLDTVFQRASAALGNLLMLCDFTEALVNEIPALWLGMTTLAEQFIGGPTPISTVVYSNFALLANTMWTLLRRTSEMKIDVIPPSSSSIICRLSRWGVKNVPSESETDAEAVRMAASGMLGIFARHPLMETADGAGPIRQLTISLLLGVLHESSLPVIAESLNSIFDVFADGTANANAAAYDAGLLGKLTSFLPILKSKIKNNKRNIDPEVRDRICDARLNLSRFLDYKN